MFNLNKNKNSCLPKENLKEGMNKMEKKVKEFPCCLKPFSFIKPDEKVVIYCRPSPVL